MATEGSLEQLSTGWGLVKKGRYLSLLVDVSKDEALVILSQRRRERALKRPFLVPFSLWLSYQAIAAAHLQTRGRPGLHEIQNGQQVTLWPASESEVSLLLFLLGLAKEQIWLGYWEPSEGRAVESHSDLD